MAELLVYVSRLNGDNDMSSSSRVIKWLLENAPTGRMHANIETVGKSSKWITLNALKVLKRLKETKNDELRELLAKAKD